MINNHIFYEYFSYFFASGIIRIVLPALTEDRRKELSKQAKSIGEEGKVAVRNIRRDAVDKIKKSEKGTEISKDDSQGFQVRIILCSFSL